jgi:VCBS repeat-containing protein
VASFAEPAVSFEVALEVTDGDDTVALGTPVAIDVANVDLPPEMTSVTLAPANPGTLADLSVQAAFTDPDAGDTDSATLDYRWLWNGEHLPEYDGLSELPGEETFKGETWAVEARVTTHGLSSDWLPSDSVAIVNTAPVAGDGAETGTEDEDIATDLDLLVADPDRDDGVDVLQFEVIAPLPVQGEFSLDGSVLTYSPNWDELAGTDTETVDIHFRAGDGQGESSAKVTFTINGVNDAPEAMVLRHIRFGEGDTNVALGTSWGDGGARGASRADTFGAGEVALWDVDSAQESVAVRVLSLPDEATMGTLLVNGTPASVGDEFGIGDPVSYQPVPGSEGTHSVELAGVDGQGAVGTGAAVKMFLNRFTATVHLDNGWNCVALPLTPDQERIEDLFADGRGDPLFVDAPLGLADGGYWVPVEAAKPGEGFVLFCQDLPLEGIDVQVPGTAAEATAAGLPGGWHLRGGIGHQSEGSIPPKPGGGAFGQGSLYRATGTGEVQVPGTMQAGQAYWFRIGSPEADVDFSLNHPLAD